MTIRISLLLFSCFRKNKLKYAWTIPSLSSKRTLTSNPKSLNLNTRINADMKRALKKQTLDKYVLLHPLKNPMTIHITIVDECIDIHCTLFYGYAFKQINLNSQL
jgi:hypothetical protein